jgi:serine/threonine protein kinase
MTSPVEQLTEDDPRVLQSSREYLAELEAGRKPNRAAYLARYPELAEALSECFDGIELAHTLRPVAAPATPPTNEFTASPLGDFQILTEIGRGGMGVVYEAIQLSLGRRVALKVLPFAAALDAKHLQRFKTEAHAAAQLHHTNIVPVYAVGCERGVHFYAMQLIEGRSLAAVIEEQRELADDERTTAVNRGSLTHSRSEAAASAPHSGRSRASFRTSARIAAQVADALEFAHESGVVHRDIKPANLLVDTKGAVWVADFGLAQVSADVSLTQTGDMVGTLRYMSPEQASGRRAPVDHRADVYSLGATLYELLTLEPIFPGQDRVSLLQQIIHDDPEPLRRHDRAVPVELETIVLKSVAKNPSERYATAGDMAADLRRFLDERPILARRPTLVDRAHKWMRRHPSVVAAAVLVLVCGLIGLAITTAVVAREHEKTRAAYLRESQRAEEAEARFQLARRAADDMIELAEDGLSESPFQEGLRKQLLEAALAYYQEFIAQRGENPDAQAELGITRDRVQKILADLAVLRSDRQNVLLSEPAVLDDLQVTDEQRQRLGTWSEQAEQQRREWRGPRGPASDEQRARMLEFARANETSLAAILTTAQLQRLRQIAVQFQGPMALRDPDVAKVLELTAAQKSRIRELESEIIPRGEFFRMRPGGGPPPPRDGGGGPRDGDGGPREGGGPHFGGPNDQRVRELMAELMAKVLTVFTDEQRGRWQQLTGRTYTGPTFFPGREGRPGPPPL